MGGRMAMEGMGGCRYREGPKRVPPMIIVMGGCRYVAGPGGWLGN